MSTEGHTDGDRELDAHHHAYEETSVVAMCPLACSQCLAHGYASIVDTHEQTVRYCLLLVRIGLGARLSLWFSPAHPPFLLSKMDGTEWLHMV